MELYVCYGIFDLVQAGMRLVLHYSQDVFHISNILFLSKTLSLLHSTSFVSYKDK
jgi:hypothetical protein